MAEKLSSLAADFAPKDAADWAQLAEQSLKGKPLASLRSERLDGIVTQPIYARSEAPNSAPGHFPYTRGTHSHNDWLIAQRIEHPALDQACIDAGDALRGGADMLLLNFAPCLQQGSAPSADTPPSPQGLMLTRPTAMRALLATSNAQNGIAFDAGANVKALAAMALASLDDASERRWHFHADPLGTLAQHGDCAQSLEALLADAMALGRHCQQQLPKARALAADGRPYHNAGASDVQELACLLATALSYARHWCQEGGTFADVSRQLVFRISLDADQFGGIAKVRALRQLWALVCEHSGAADSARAMFVHAEAAERMHTRRDPWVNLLRGTTATAAAAIAGVDALTLSPFDRRLAQDSALGQRMSRNTQLILRDESQLHQVADAAGGSGYIESLTESLCEAAWHMFQAIESEGGMAAALHSGFVHASIADTQAQRRRLLAKRKNPITGVSEFPHVAEALPQDAAIDAASAYAAALDEAAATPVELGQDIPTLQQGFAAQASLPVMSIAPQMEPLPMAYLDADYEALRAHSDRWAQEHSAAPSISVVTLGSAADYTARATFAKNLFEAGGIHAQEHTVAQATGVLAVICSSDALYAERAHDTARQLKAQGVQRVYLAGRGGEQETALRDAGVDEYIYLGVDVLAVLRQAHSYFGGAA